MVSYLGIYILILLADLLLIRSLFHNFKVYRQRCLSIRDVFIGTEMNEAKITFLQTIDITRIATYVFTIFGNMIIFTIEDGNVASLILQDIFPNIVLLFEVIAEVSSLRIETFQNTVPLLLLFLIDGYGCYSNVDKFMATNARIALSRLLLRLLVLVIYRGFIRNIKAIKRGYYAAYDMDMSHLLENTKKSIDVEGEGNNDVIVSSPEDKVGLLSRLIYGWLAEVMAIGYERPLEEKDFYGLLDADKILNRTERFQKAFKNELHRKNRTIHEYSAFDEKKRKASYFIFIRTVIYSGALESYLYTIFLSSCYDVLDFAPPQLLRAILIFMGDREASILYGILLIILLSSFSILQTFLDTQSSAINTRQYQRIRGALQTALYHKALKLTSSSKDRQTVGQISNLMTTDVHRITMLIYHTATVVSAVLNLILVNFFLYRELGYATFVAESIIIITIPITGYIARKIDTSQDALMKVRDRRIKITTQMLSAIKALKLYGWDRVFRTKIEKVRNEELGKLKVCIYWELLTNFVWPMNFILVTFATFGSYTVIQGNSLDAATTFTTLSLLGLLQYPLSAIPLVIMSFVESRVSLRRVSAYLLSEEIRPEYVNSSHSDNALEIEIKAAFWDDKRKTKALSNISLSIPKHDFCFVTGLVGSGKSAFLNLILNELSLDETEENKIVVNGSIAYTSQVPWVQNATVRENILFGKPYEKVWYEKVIFACALIDDFNQFPNGDSTEIGERGINLSGGQKARLSLARAVYSRHEILLLESCFEAVDEHVGDHIWEHCFLGILKDNVTLICVTHALKRLREVDRVIVMSAGTVVGNAAFHVLEEAGHEDFKKLIDALEENQTHEINKKIDESERQDSKGVEQAKLKESETGDGKELTGDEEKKTGSVSLDIYISYLRAGGGCRTILLTCTLYVGVTVLSFFNSRWLAYASDHFARPQKHQLDYFVRTPFLLNSSIPNIVDSRDFLEVYAVISLAQIVFLLGSTAAVLYGGYRASKTIHNKVLYHVIRSPMSFFDTTPNGRIINRFAKDMNMVDEELPYTFIWFVRLFFQTIGTIFSVAYVTPQFLISLPFAWVMYRNIQQYYIASQREMQRWSSVLKSPVYSLFQESLEGVATIRAYKREDSFKTRNIDQIEKLNRAAYLSIALNKWLSVRIRFTGNCLRTFAGIFIILNRTTIGAGLAGLAFSFSFNITSVLNWGVRMLAYLETELVSVERLTQYMELTSEAPEMKEVGVDLKVWPDQGSIQMTNVSGRYRDGLPLVLRGLSMTIKGGEKVGIVGRTGAGKSSLFLVLLRIVEPCGGQAMIDGVDLQSLGTLQLRKKIAVIPQDPVIFAGTVRFNLDPSRSFSDTEIVEVLKTCRVHDHLLHLLEEKEQKNDNDNEKQTEREEDEEEEAENSEYPELFLKLTESGSNLSFGQRQLFCIARALLTNSKILLLDEATSGIDLATDKLIQDMIRSQFASRTVLTIAHRIETIIDGDKVAVMSDGQVAEFGSPAELLQEEKSIFSDLVKSMKGK